MFDCSTVLIEMNRKHFLAYFKKKSQAEVETDDEIQVTRILSAATENVSEAELTFAEEELNKSYSRPHRYSKDIPDSVKIEVSRHARDLGTASAIKKYTIKYPKYTFNRTTVNSWKSRYKENEKTVGKKVGRPNILDDNLLKKVMDIAIGTRMAGGVVNRRQLIGIATGVIRANCPERLKEFGGTLELTEKWARGVLKKLNWSKRKGTTGKVDPSPQFLAEEKYTFQRNISAVVTEHDVPPFLILNIDQTPLSYVTPGKYTFNFKGAKNVPMDDKRQITATFAVSCIGDFLPMQLIYSGKTSRCLPKYNFPDTFSVSFTENHWSNTEKSVQFFNEIIFPYLENIKHEKGYPSEQFSLIIMDTFKGQDNDTLKDLCRENNCAVVIVPHNLTNKFQPLDISVNKAAKAFIQNKYNDWFANHVSSQLQNGTDPANIKISSKISELKPLHASWVVDLYHYLREEKEMVKNGFDSAGISDAIQNARDIFKKIENPFRE